MSSDLELTDRRGAAAPSRERPQRGGSAELPWELQGPRLLFDPAFARSCGRECLELNCVMGTVASLVGIAAAER